MRQDWRRPDYPICAIARTAEAKALGIRMGDPWFKIRDLCRREGVRVFSSNYALYGDMSRRTNAIYDRFSHMSEIYSIDESFLDLTDMAPGHRVELGRDLRSTVLAWTGIPTCVGIGPTKTLAKLANHLAKKNLELGGVCDLTDVVARDRWLPRTSLDEIWGVGPASQARLRAIGCATVADVRDLAPRLARQGMTVVGERIVHELRGECCLDLETVAPTRKGCAVTRCFSGRVEDRATVEQAVATHAARLGEKLRRYALGTDHVTVFYHTSEHDRGSPQRSASMVVTLPEATNDTLVLVKGGDLGRAASVARPLPLQQGGDHHRRPCAARCQPARDAEARPVRPRTQGGADGGDGRLQRLVRARHGCPGSGWCRAGTGRRSSRCDRPATPHGSPSCSSFQRPRNAAAGNYQTSIQSAALWDSWVSLNSKPINGDRDRRIFTERLIYRIES